MGANATTFVPAYVSGEVLTAADLSVTNSGIPVFADSTARDAAFGGTGEKVLAEGQYAYLESTNATQFYDGAAWQSVGTTPGLAFISAASFTTATTVSFATNTFTSTYRNYRVIFDVTNITADSAITMRYRASGTDDSAANYNYGFSMYPNTGVVIAAQGVNQTSIFGGYVNDASGGGGLIGGQFVIDLIDPQTTNKTTMIASFMSTDSVYNTAGVFMGGCNKNATTQFDSMTFISSVASSMTGVYRVYGYSES